MRLTFMRWIFTSTKHETKNAYVPHMLVRSLSAKYRPDRYRRYKSVKFGTELP